MIPEDLDRDLQRLWARVSSSRAEEAPPSADPPSAQAETLEAMALMKRQHRQRERDWAELLEAKERALAASRTRQEELEREVMELRRRDQAGDARIMSEVLDAQAQLDAGMKSLAAERDRTEEQAASLRAVLESTRQRLAAETMRNRRLQEQWEDQEQRTLSDLQELRLRAERHQEEATFAGKESLRLTDHLKEAKNALEKTLAELLLERQVREETEGERAQALKKVSQLEEHFKELAKLWEEERSQWRELWDRERAAWEGQRKQFSAWEEGLRQERSALAGTAQTQEQRHVEFMTRLGDALRESTESSLKLAAVMRIIRGVSGRDAGAPLPRSRRLVLAAAGLVVAALIAFGAVERLSKPRLAVVSTQPVLLENPTALTFDGAMLWAAEWDGGIFSFDPQDLRNPVKRWELKALAPYRPAALAHAGEYLWSIDAAQARLVQHRAGRPDVIISSRPAPGPAPAALAHDGAHLWLYDAASQSLYRLPAEGGDFTPVPADTEFVPSALAWVDGRLWAVDGRSRELMVFTLEGGRLQLASRQPFAETAVALMPAAGGDVWVLAGPGMDRPGHALVKYRL